MKLSLFRYLTLFALMLFFTACSGDPFGTGCASKGVVVLDIGHYFNASRGTGAMSPVMRDGSRIEETAFWYRYSGYVKGVVEKAGYKCIVTNRGRTPQSAELAAIAKRVPVVQLNRPDTRGVNGKPARYPSHFHPEHIAAGMASADYAIWKKASCVAFLHHDSASDHWQRVYKSTILHNVRNGRSLAQFVASSINSRILGDTPGKMPNNGRLCRLEPRFDADLGGAAWLNTCDASGIPAIVIEATMLNNPDHAYWLAQDENAIRFAEAVGRGIVSYLKATGK